MDVIVPESPRSLQSATNEPAQDLIRLLLTKINAVAEDMASLRAQSEETNGMLRTLLRGFAGPADLSLPPDVVLPFQDKDGLQRLEALLQEDPNLEDRLTISLAARGGKSTKEAVTCMCSALFTNPLAKEMNWTGSGSKLKFQTLQLKTIVHIPRSRSCWTETTTPATGSGPSSTWTRQTCAYPPISPRHPRARSGTTAWTSTSEDLATLLRSQILCFGVERLLFTTLAAPWKYTRQHSNNNTLTTP